MSNEKRKAGSHVLNDVIIFRCYVPLIINFGPYIPIRHWPTYYSPNIVRIILFNSFKARQPLQYFHLDFWCVTLVIV